MFLSSAFKITLTTYLLLIFVEVLQPGFVSNYVSAHWLLFVALGCFVLLVSRGEQLVIQPWLVWGVTTLVAFIFAVVTWRLGAELQELRPLIVLVALALPFGIVRAFEQTS